MKCKCSRVPTVVVLEVDGKEQKLRVGDMVSYGWSQELSSPKGQASWLTVEHRGDMKVLRFE